MNRPRRLGLYEDMTDDMAREYHEATYSVGLGAGFLFSKQVDMSNRTLLLDLGGGSGAYCIAAVQRYPGIKAVVMDFKTGHQNGPGVHRPVGHAGSHIHAGGRFYGGPVPTRDPM